MDGFVTNAVSGSRDFGAATIKAVHNKKKHIPCHMLRLMVEKAEEE
jgi:hypothetical protein